MMLPLPSCGELNLHNKLLMIVAPQPIVPPIHTHDGVVEVNGCLTKKIAFETEVNIEDGANQTSWINPNAFFS